jgi:putative ABC transport system permease protein
MTMLRQILAVTILNFKSLPNRLWPSLVVVVGIACVVGVLLSMLSLVTGYVDSEMKAGDPGRAIVIADGVENENASSLTRDQVNIIKDGPGIKKDVNGSPLAEAEVMVGTPATRKGGVFTYILIRGFGPKSVALRPEFKIVSGRMVRPGAQEMVVGRAAQQQFASVNVGDKIVMPNGPWPIVGVFTTNGDILEGELIADRDTLMAAVKRNALNSVLARLDSTPNSMDILKSALTGNPALSVIAERHSTYYEHFSAVQATLFRAVAYVVGGIMALGALFGALNTMYAAVSARRREIATLRAIGFGAFPVALSVVTEALVLALSGALIGSAIAWLLFNGSQKAYFNNVFDLKVTPSLIGLGIGWALVVALLGGLLPSIRAARLPIVDALRAT